MEGVELCSLNTDAVWNHAELLWRWQCDEGTQAYTLGGKIPSWDEHVAWLERKLADDGCSFYLITSSRAPSGVIRLDREADGYFRVSIIVAPDARGRGIGPDALRRLGELGFRLRAQVSVANKASHAAFRRAGYTRVGEELYENAPRD